MSWKEVSVEMEKIERIVVAMEQEEETETKTEKESDKNDRGMRRKGHRERVQVHQEDRAKGNTPI